MTSSSQHGMLVEFRPAPALANKEHKILQHNREVLVSQVTSIKLVEFSAELCRSLVISQEVYDTFSALDDTVVPELRVRYLLLQVCGGVKHDVTVFHRFLKVLAGYGGHAEEVSICLGEEWCLSEREEEGQSVIHVAGGSQEVGDDLFEVDVVYLMKILAGVTYKWEELGIALGLPKAVLEECRSAHNNTLKLHNLLCMWIKGKYPSAKHATLKNLKQILAGEIVGVGDVALSLEEKFWEAKGPEPIIGALKTPGLATALSIVYQSCSTKVADGKSTLLEVQVNESEAVCYQWMKDGKSLSDNIAYSGTLTAILAISPARQGTDGKYTCRIMKGSEEVISKEILLTISFPMEKKHLITLYSKNTDVPRDSWPPKVTNTYINLALITKKKEFTDDHESSIRGDIDDILETKEKVEFVTVFGEYECGALVLVEGRPGSGKTTLVHKVTRDWATGGNVLNNAKLVFLITLRDLANRKTECLSDILDNFYPDRDECEKVVTDIKKTNGQGVCFIIDGLDEFHPQEETTSVIHQLVYEKYLHEAMVIVASRPVATDKLRCEPHVTRRIEVLGFSHQQILEYVENYPFNSNASNSNTSASQLKAYLNSHHNLLHMCYLPVHVGMICFLYQHEKGDIPITETEIYEHFTRFIVLRNLRRSNQKAELNSLDDLCGKDKEYFSNLCHLAFDMTIHSTQTVHQRDTKVPLSHGACKDDAASLGLVTIDKTSGLHRLDDRYAFLHLTLQEYLAAFYLAKQKKKEQKKIIKLYAGEKHMRMLWKFFCGIVKSENKVAEIQHIMWPADRKRPKDDILYELHCAFVSQQRVLCDSFVKRRAGVLDFNTCILTPADMTAVGYVISTTSHHVTELTMSSCLLHDDHIRTLLKEVSHSKLNLIQKLRFFRNNIGNDGAAALADGLKSCNNLQTLVLAWNNIGVEGAIALADGLKSCNNLQTLLLEHNNIGDDGAAALANDLKTCSNLKTLYLSENNIGDIGATALANGLKTYNNLQTLHLRGNNFSYDGIGALRTHLKLIFGQQLLIDLPHPRSKLFYNTYI